MGKEILDHGKTNFSEKKIKIIEAAKAPEWMREHEAELAKAGIHLLQLPANALN